MTSKHAEIAANWRQRQQAMSRQASRGHRQHRRQTTQMEECLGLKLPAANIAIVRDASSGVKVTG